MNTSNDLFAVTAFNITHLQPLLDYLSLPSISNTQQMIPETVTFLKNYLISLAADVHIWDDLGGNPVIYASFSATNATPLTPTLLFYNHYDVQPPAPLEEWLSPPFDPVVRDNILYARGIADNKGNLMARLNAIAYLQATNQHLPCHVKFLIEGEEEIGSPNLEKYLAKYQSLLAADACIWEAGGKNDDDVYEITAGVKGMAYFELTVQTATVDLHSSLGAIAQNPAWRLVQALASLKDTNNQILISHFFDDIVPPTDYEQTLAANYHFDQVETEKKYGFNAGLITDNSVWSPAEALLFQPTLTICGLTSGYQAPGIKTVLPKVASAKIDCRLVRGQTPATIAKHLQAHLIKHHFNDVQLTLLLQEHPYKTPLTDPFVATVLNSAKKIYGTTVRLSPTNPGTGPMYLFNQYLQLPILSAGTSWSKSNAHAPNESIRLADFHQGVAYILQLFNDFSQSVLRR